MQESEFLGAMPSPFVGDTAKEKRRGRMAILWNERGRE